MPKALPQEIKEKARRMVMNGTTRKDVALMLGITHSSVYIWTRDIKLPRIKTTPKQDSIMKILLERGYFIPEKHSEVDTLRLLKERHGIKIASVKASHVAFVKGRETDALKAFLRRKRIHCPIGASLRD
jgi:transposase